MLMNINCITTRHNYLKHLACGENPPSIVHGSPFSSMLSQTAFNIAGHYYQHWGEEPKEVFQQLCPILELSTSTCGLWYCVNSFVMSEWSRIMNAWSKLDLSCDLMFLPVPTMTMIMVNTNLIATN